MKKLFLSGIAFSVLISTSVTFASETSLSCVTVQEGKIDTSMRFGMGPIESIDTYLAGLDMSKIIKDEELLSSNEHLILDMTYDDEGCENHSLGKITTVCNSEGIALAKLDGIALKDIPYAYNPNSNKVYYIEQKIDDESVLKYTGTWSLKECSLGNKEVNNINKGLEKKENVIKNDQKIESNNVVDSKSQNNNIVSKKDYKKLNNMPLFQLVEYFGYNWKKDRKALAEQFGIKNYKGTAKQNMIIKKKLLEKISVQ